jgi:hypothetical protein
VINFRGVAPVYLPAVWKILIPPRVHFFLWLVSKNKLLSRDNLENRRKLDDTSCLFCAEIETTHHLLFECVVVKRAWELISQVAGFELGSNYESIAKLWLCNKKFGVINIVSSAVCWSIEIEKLLVLSGSALVWHEGAVATTDSPPALLENPGAAKDERCLRRCLLGAGEDGNVSRTNHAIAAPSCNA